MKSVLPIHILIFFLPVIALPCLAYNFDFYYFILRWPGSACESKAGCCYPRTGKPASDFIVHGLQPYSNLGEEVVNCGNKPGFHPCKNVTSSLQKHWPSLKCPRRDGTKLWSSQWKKYGICSNSDQNKYFASAVYLKKKLNLLKILNNAGIVPNGTFYDPDSISETIRLATGHTPGVGCIGDKSGNTLINLVYTCAYTGGTAFMECPGMHAMNCNTGLVKFPSF